MVFGVIGSFRVPAEKQDRLAQLFAALAKEVRAHEPLNLCYRLLKIKGDDTAYRLVELYETEEAFVRHSEAEYLARVLPQLAECMAGAPDVALVHDALGS